ncbi:hypothetical protein BG006_009427 [Podila minutissima]|uniref:Centromere protein X n=1 Tax=Podila minutissima TaxID=64525 RepID=A0A9P5SEI1_9FUNG|nr:hypothetical protein BG006_009427 [Podila minutissima]
MNSDIEIYSDSDQDYRRPSTFGKKGGGGSSFRRAPSDELDEIEDLGTPPGGEAEEDDEEEAPRSRPQKGDGGKGSGSKNRTGGGGALTSGFTTASRLNVGKGTGSTVAKPGARRFVVDEDSDGKEHDDTPAFKPETMQGIFKGVWSNPDTKVHRDAMKLSAEFLRLFTIEALHRAVAYQREQEEDDLLRDDEMLLDVESLEAITPQLLLDF